MRATIPTARPAPIDSNDVRFPEFFYFTGDLKWQAIPSIRSMTNWFN